MITRIKNSNQLALLPFFGFILLQGCAIDPDYLREYPGIDGNVQKQSKPATGISVVYGKYINPDLYPCTFPLGTVVTDDSGRFSIPIERKIQLVTVLPLEEGKCKFAGELCFEDGQAWRFEITGQGEKEYHTNENILESPHSLFFMTAEGRCEAPEWITVQCDLAKENEERCEIINPQYDPLLERR